jgi:hypothetical protein
MNMADHQIKFLLADEIRSEVSGKVIVLGLYSDNTLLVVPDKAERAQTTDADAEQARPGIAILSVLTIITGKPGEFDGWFKLIDPNGNLVSKNLSAHHIVVKPDRHVNVIARFAPFVVTAYGTWRFEFTLDSETTTFEFRVLERLKWEEAVAKKTTASRKQKTLDRKASKGAKASKATP